MLYTGGYSVIYPIIHVQRQAWGAQVINHCNNPSRKC